MTGHEPDERAQADFERSLFESARGDAPLPSATERAWRRFAADAALLAPVAAAPSAPRGWFDGAAARAAKWTAIGAIGGGSLVAVWLSPPAPREPLLAPTSVALRPSSEVAPAHIEAPALAEPAAATEPAPASEAAPASTPPAPGHGARPRKSSGASLSSRASQTSAAESLLAREVAALDAARTALAVGASASALRQIERYHRDFPQGELSADADVVAIEALAAEGERAATKRAARRFLRQYPRDPHVAHIRELAR
jgi:hypothetical protein